MTLRRAFGRRRRKKRQVETYLQCSPSRRRIISVVRPRPGSILDDKTVGTTAGASTDEVKGSPLAVEAPSRAAASSCTRPASDWTSVSAPSPSMAAIRLRNPASPKVGVGSNELASRTASTQPQMLAMARVNAAEPRHSVQPARLLSLRNQRWPPALLLSAAPPTQSRKSSNFCAFLSCPIPFRADRLNFEVWVWRVEIVLASDVDRGVKRA
jgi:hypothetical protein